MEQLPSTSRQGICEVCSDVSASIHFGVLSCRACSAFFRRAITENKKFICRVKGNCPVHKTQKCICKRCRFVKCYQVGMQITGVQGARSSSKTTIQPPISIQPEPSLEATEEPVLLMKIQQNYEDLYKIRKGTEKALFQNRDIVTEGPLAGYSACSVESVAIIGKAHLPSYVEFINNTFDEFSELTEEEKWTLIKPFHIYFQWLDCCWSTYQVLPPHLYTSYSIISPTTYWDANLHSSCWFDIEKAPKFMQESLTQLRQGFVKEEMKKKKQRSLSEIARIQVREIEMAALVGLLFWNSCVENCSEKAQQIMNKTRKRIFADLGIYYKQFGEEYPEIRLGELLNILSIVQVEAHRFRRNLEIFNIFGTIDKEDYFFKYLQEIK